MIFLIFRCFIWFFFTPTRILLIFFYCCCCCSATKLCPVLCDPLDCSIPGSLTCRVSQSFVRFMSVDLVMLSNHLISSNPQLSVCLLSCFSCVRLFGTLWTVAHQVPLSVGFFRWEYGVGCHFLLQGIFPTQGPNPQSLMSPALEGRFCNASAAWESPPQLGTIS